MLDCGICLTNPTAGASRVRLSRTRRRSARPCRFVFLLESGVWVMATGETVLRELLAEQRSGVKLHTIVQETLFTFMSDMEMVEESDHPESAREWFDMAVEAFDREKGGTMQPPILSRTGKWSGVDLPEAPAAAAPATLGGAAGQAAGGAAPPTFAASNDPMLEGIEVSTIDEDKAKNDIKAQGISGARVLALSMSLEVGVVQSLTKVMHGKLAYGADPRTMEEVRTAKKAGIMTLTKVIEAKDTSALVTHFMSLAREYATRQMIEESTLISRFWAETSVHFPGDQVFPYLVEYLHKVYCGRGLPTVFDLALAWRVTRGDDGAAADVAKVKKEMKAVTEALAEAKREAKESKEAVKALRTANDTLTQRVGQLRPAPTKPGEQSAGKGKKCFKCGEFGHIAANCPNAGEEAEKEE